MTMSDHNEGNGVAELLHDLCYSAVHATSFASVMLSAAFVDLIRLTIFVVAISLSSSFRTRSHVQSAGSQ